MSGGAIVASAVIGAGSAIYSSRQAKKASQDASNRANAARQQQQAEATRRQEQLRADTARQRAEDKAERDKIRAQQENEQAKAKAEADRIRSETKPIGETATVKRKAPKKKTNAAALRKDKATTGDGTATSGLGFGV